MPDGKSGGRVFGSHGDDRNHFEVVKRLLFGIDQKIRPPFGADHRPPETEAGKSVIPGDLTHIHKVLFAQSTLFPRIA